MKASNNNDDLEKLKEEIIKLEMPNEEDKLNQIKEILKIIKLENKEDKLKEIEPIFEMINKEDKKEIKEINNEQIKDNNENKNKNIDNKTQNKILNKEILYQLIKNISPLDEYKDKLEFYILIKNCEINKISNLFIELQKTKYKCNLCTNIYFENVYNCLFCESFYICKNCYKSLNKKKINAQHEHEQEYFYEIIIPNTIKEIFNYNTTLQEFNDLLRKIFFDDKGNFIKNDLNDNEFKKINKHLIPDFISRYQNAFPYLTKYKEDIINPMLNCLPKDEQSLINGRFNAFNLKLQKIKDKSKKQK